jgi:hypothetical protein
MLMKSFGVSWSPLFVVAPDEVPEVVLYAGDVLVAAGMGVGATVE